MYRTQENELNSQIAQARQHMEDQFHNQIVEIDAKLEKGTH
jgi:hypothetical protein